MPTYYDVDLRNSTLREFAFGTAWYMMPVIALIKFCRMPMHGSTDDPPVESLVPFEIDEAALPEDIRIRFAPVAAELESLGFRPVLHHAIPYARQATRSYWATYVHESGKAWARIHCRIWWAEGRDRFFFFPMFFTALEDGSFLVSSAGKQDMLMPDGVRMVNQIDANATELWERHNQELAANLTSRPIRIDGMEHLRGLMEQHHAKLRDFNLQRGVFLPLPEAEQQQMTATAGPETEPLAVSEDAAVFAELERLQNSQSSKWSGLLVLAVSLALFAGAAKFGQDWRFMLSLIPILLFHELGHYVAMRWFGYRNLKMFFIPFLGAAVSGQHYNVAGWKKAVVALAGPVPGILVGAALGAAGWWFQYKQLIDAAVLMVILNGFNLLPLLPLDGGWVAHAVLFVRHPVLDVASRILAILAMISLCLVSGNWFLYLVPLFMFLSLPMTWRIARLAQRLRREGVNTTSPNAQTIPPETAALLLTELRLTAPQVKMPQLQAQYVMQTFETLNARPPGVLASLAILSVHGLSFLAAVALPVLLLWAQFARPQPTHDYVPGSTRAWSGVDVRPPRSDARVTIIAEFRSAASAQSASEKIAGELPRNATLRLFGDHLLMTLPADREQEHTSWLARLRKDALKVQMHHNMALVFLVLSCEADTEAAAERLETEFREAQRPPAGHLMLPTWSAAWPLLPEKDRQQYRKARQTYQRLEQLRTQAAQHPEVRELSQRAMEADRQGDRDKAAELHQAMTKASTAQVLRLLDRIRAEEKKELDLPLLEIWEQLEKVPVPPGAEKEEPNAEELARLEAWGKERQAINGRMAVRMGCVPMVDGRPMPGSDLDVLHLGTVNRHGRKLTFNMLTFPHPDEGLPALAEWLCRNGCRNVRYGFLDPVRGILNEPDEQQP